jgi:hypothetical protein
LGLANPIYEGEAMTMYLEHMPIAPLGTLAFLLALEAFFSPLNPFPDFPVFTFVISSSRYETPEVAPKLMEI